MQVQKWQRRSLSACRRNRGQGQRGADGLWRARPGPWARHVAGRGGRAESESVPRGTRPRPGRLRWLKRRRGGQGPGGWSGEPVTYFGWEGNRMRKETGRRQGLTFRRNFAEILDFFPFPLVTGIRNFGIFRYISFQNSTNFVQNPSKSTEIYRNFGTKFRFR